MTACTSADTQRPAGQGKRSEQLQVVATVPALSDLAAILGADRVDVTTLGGGRAEPHDFEPTPDQLDQILDADLVLSIGPGFQPAIDSLLSRRDSPTFVAVDELALTDYQSKRFNDDPHLWLDPSLMARLVLPLTETFSKLDPAGKDFYKDRAETDAVPLFAEIDASFTSAFESCDRFVLVTSHSAFGWLADRYGLRQEALRVRPESDATVGRIDELMGVARDEDVTTIFAESGESDDALGALAREMGGLDVATLDTLEMRPTDAPTDGTGYRDAMYANLEVLIGALGCASDS